MLVAIPTAIPAAPLITSLEHVSEVLQGYVPNRRSYLPQSTVSFSKSAKAHVPA